MNLTQLMAIVVSSQTKDWHQIGCWGCGSGPSYRDHLTFYNVYDGGQKNVLHVTAHSNIAVYLHDVSITLAFGLNWMEEFKEDWTGQFPDSGASASYVDVFYNGVLVYRDRYVTVDGGRTKLPLPPRRDTLDVPQAYAQFIRLLNSFEGTSHFDSDFRRAGMTVSDKTWPDFGSDKPTEDGEAPRGLIQ